MKITVFESDKQIEEMFSKTLAGHELVFVNEKLTELNINKAKEADIISVFINSIITADVFNKLGDLKMIDTRSTGVDHIDLVSAKTKSVVISNVPRYGARAVAEFTFALLLSLSRKIFYAYEQIRERASFDYGELQGFDLSGRTLGIIGTGRIGCNVAKIARGFDMSVIANDLYPNEDLAREIGFEYKDFDDVVTKADILSLHVPHTPENVNLINRDVLAKVKKGVCIVNTARGDLIDSVALVEAIKAGQVAGAALDVLESESDMKEEASVLSKDLSGDKLKDIIANNILFDMPEVIVTPHIAFHSLEADAERIQTSADNIRLFIDGKSQNVIE